MSIGGHLSIELLKHVLAPDFLASHLLGANRNIVLICNPSRFSPFLDPWSVSSGTARPCLNISTSDGRFTCFVGSQSAKMATGSILFLLLTPSHPRAESALKLKMDDEKAQLVA